MRPFPKLIPVIVVSLLLAINSAMGAAQRNQKEPKKLLTAKEVFANYHKEVFQVTATRVDSPGVAMKGSGFRFVTASGDPDNQEMASIRTGLRSKGFKVEGPFRIVVLTAFHVVKGAQEISLKDSEGNSHEVDRISYDEAADIAVLFLNNEYVIDLNNEGYMFRWTNGSDAPALSDWIAGLKSHAVAKAKSGPTRPLLHVALFADVAVGETVFTLGNPLGLLPESISQGIVAGKRKIDGVPFVQLTAAASPGNSGGPVIDDQGRVVGIVSFKVLGGESLNMATAMNEPLRLMRKQRSTLISAFYVRN